MGIFGKQQITKEEEEMLRKMRENKEKQDMEEIKNQENENEEIVNGNEDEKIESNNIYKQLNDLFQNSSVEEIIGVIEIYKSMLLKPNEE